MHITIQKKELRRTLKANRSSVAAEKKKADDKKILDILLKTTTFRLTDTLLIYHSVGSEISTMDIINVSLERGITVCLPRCTKNENNEDIMIFHRIDSLEDLHIGMYDIPEPADDFPLYEPKGHCVCIVPALAFDRRGYRIGYGKGYYDRFLRDFRGTKIGLCYSDFLLDTIPVGKYDSKVDMIITEKGIFTPNA
ncbi:MAG: 5-formyltetrahydrofolate cyclo-ligase [Ruminococcaceae bacterium]|nr:5-formyltetrahydrofolate cyclo-ligase [Oscillospiraceae bacterium]